MSDDTKDRDPAHETMPPELRPFAKPEPPQRLVAPENEAKFNAAIGALRILNGGPQADPFYVDPKHDPALAERAAPESVKAYVPPTAVPTPEAKARQSAPAKVVIAEARSGSLGPVPSMVGEIDTRMFRGAMRRTAERGEASSARVATGDDEETGDEITRPKSDKSQETPASPWSKEAPIPDLVRGSALPSSLGPRGLPATEGEDPASTRPSNEKPAGVSSPGRKTTAAIAIALLVVSVAIGLRALVTARKPENGSQGPAPSAQATAAVPTGAAPPPSAPTASPSVQLTATTSATALTSATAITSAVVAPRPKPRGALEDPYGDASAPPNPTVKAAPQVTAVPSAAPAPTVTPSVTPPKASPSATSSEKPVYD